ncbi:MAG: preprotein translocase subunit SecE [Candidatus Desulforudis sp.]|nr:preprotein translocase subunit SecE [Desulforudis sp.]
MGEGRKREGNDTARKTAGKDPRKEQKLKRDARKAPPPTRRKPGEGVIKTSRRFFEGVWHELKKVHWPTRREVTIYTGVVLVSVMLVGVILMVADLILSQILARIIT